MKRETKRRVKNIIRVLKMGEVGTEVWETGYYRIVWWSTNDYRPKKVVYGKLKMI